ncbi:MAG: ABC transporter substrate-binding protein [Leptolyngbya sp.]|nr:MAG: ABC transporter substrate-binding protein [Leptolyngbya sp.]
MVNLKRYLISGLIKQGDRPQLRSKSRSTIGYGIVVAGLILLLLAVSPAYTQSPPSSTPSTAPPLRIATRLIRPDVFKEDGKLVGFSVDIGRNILEQLQRKADLKTYADVPGILNAIRLGQADVGIAAIAITKKREQEFDFSYPVLSGELQIMVLSEGEQSRNAERDVLQRLLDPSLLRLFGSIALLMLIPVHILWYFERNNPELIDNPSYIPGIFQALWWTLLALVGQAEDMPKRPVARIMALFWVFVGIIFLTYFTAIITAELTVQEFQSNIQGLGDLQKRPVAVIADPEAIDYLQEQNLQQVFKFAQPEPAYEALLAKKVDAIIAPGPLLFYYASHNGKGKVQIVGTPFREQFYSIVMPKNSPYRKPINQAILTLKENGTYGKIHRKWFGVRPQD